MDKEEQRQSVTAQIIITISYGAPDPILFWFDNKQWT